MNFLKRTTLYVLIFLSIFAAGLLLKTDFWYSIACISLGSFILLGVIVDYPLKSKDKIKKESDIPTFEIDNRKYIRDYYQIIYNDKLHQLEPVTPVSLYSAQNVESKVASLLNISKQDYEANLICNHDAIYYEEEQQYDKYHIVIFKDLEKAKAVCELFETQIVTNAILNSN